MPTNPAYLPVYFIGVGPGDPELLTIKGQRIIQGADVIIYADSLIPAAILSLAKPNAEIIATSGLTLEEIVPLMIDRVQADKSVVRLHSGDLTLYSAINEQLQQLRAAQIPCQLIPGISVFQAAAAALQVELTVPELVQTIILTRIQGRASAMPPTETLASLAAHRSSLCLYLAAGHIAEAQQQLLQHYPPDTPVAICYRVSWPDAQISIVPLSQLAEASTSQGFLRSTMYLISPALAQVQTGLARSRLYHPQHSHLFRDTANSTGVEINQHV
jgi:precorrin-4/cobalt-precorrin-4 C11-methyltransferase